MIMFAKAGHGTHYDPKTRNIRHVALGKAAIDFRIVALDTGTNRPGLEKSTYKIRRSECDTFAAMLKEKFGFNCLAEIRTPGDYDKVMAAYRNTHPDLCDRLNYIFHAQQRFYDMLTAWQAGNVEEVGRIFRQDGLGLRDEYRISGPELETMCDIARTVPGVLGERMLGGGDKGASGAICRADAVDALRAAVETGYPRTRPAYADKFAMHVCNMVDGVTILPGL
jgi:galactokinase